ncbi:MAG TPA: hypothetical protein VMM92_01365, partial [Thermoanaerobaculia bacterium]|nr:hypothetical protein [Thermoanaerobaculia bacterium]
FFCAIALLALGCQRGTPSAEQSPASPPAQSTESQVAQATPPAAPTPAPAVSPLVATEHQDVEQPPRAVEPPPKTPQPDEKSARERRLEERERRLAERQAALNARERRLRQQDSSPQAAPVTPETPPAEPSAAAAPAEPAASPEPVPAPEPPRPEPVTVSAGTRFEIKFNRSLSSETSAVGETFRARVAQDVYVGDRLAIPAGSEVVGEVNQAVPRRKIGGQASLGLHFTDLVLPNGETVAINASLVQAGESKSGRDAATIGGAAAGGAILGRIFNKGGGKGTLLGALIGAVAGTAIAANHPGEPVTIPEGTLVNINLDRPIEVNRRR